VNASQPLWKTALKELQPDAVAWIREPMLDNSLVDEYRVVLAEACGDAAVHELECPGGEALKALDKLPELFERFTEWHLTRHSIVITTGGGALSDAVGFAASVWKRGVKVIHIPTTTLAMVDAAWGGKTALNWGGMKNQIGTFELPAAVQVDARWLVTLPEREFRAGLAEAAKHAMLEPAGDLHLNSNLPQWPVQTPDSLETWTNWLVHSADTKRRIASEDLHERGRRAVLNLGHTVGHAVEALLADSRNTLLHGEAVAIGLHFALHEARNPVWKVGQNSEDVEPHAALVETWLRENVPVPPVDLPDAERMWDCMLHDKKNTAFVVQDVAWRGLGSVIWPVAWKKTSFEATWTRFVRFWDDL